MQEIIDFSLNNILLLKLLLTSKIYGQNPDLKRSFKKLNYSHFGGILVENNESLFWLYAYLRLCDYVGFVFTQLKHLTN